MLHVVRTAEPPNFERLRVIVVVGDDVQRAADFAGLWSQLPTLDGILNPSSRPHATRMRVLPSASIRPPYLGVCAPTRPVCVCRFLQVVQTPATLRSVAADFALRPPPGVVPAANVKLCQRFHAATACASLPCHHDSVLGKERHPAQGIHLPRPGAQKERQPAWSAKAALSLCPSRCRRPRLSSRLHCRPDSGGSQGFLQDSPNPLAIWQIFLQVDTWGSGEPPRLRRKAPSCPCERLSPAARPTRVPIPALMLIVWPYLLGGRPLVVSQQGLRGDEQATAQKACFP